MFGLDASRQRCDELLQSALTNLEPFGRSALPLHWLARYIVDERGALRRHVNIFVGDELIYDRDTLSDPVNSDSRVFIFQALSGG